jgi:orotidine 5'-phosphate decarboxylase subfamily 1
MEPRERIGAEASLRLKRIRAYRTGGHFKYASGRHGSVYVNCRLLKKHPAAMAWFVERLVEMCANVECAAVAGTGTLGEPLAVAVAKRMSEVRGRAVTAVLFEKDMTLKAPVELSADASVVVVDDTLTTSGTVSRLMAAVRSRLGAKIAAVAVAVNRSGLTAIEDSPVFVWVLGEPMQSWPAEECRLCAEGIPLDDGKADWPLPLSGPLADERNHAYARMIVLACDTDDRDKALRLVSRLAPWQGLLKVHSLYLKYGEQILRDLESAGAVGGFWGDLKFADTPPTNYANAVAWREKGFTFATVHGITGVEGVREAVRGFTADGTDEDAEVAVITVLTSLGPEEAELIFNRPVLEQVKILTGVADAAGAHGVVCSGLELEELIKMPRGLGNRNYSVPGVRSAGVAAGSQKRVVTPREAILNGATRVVVGTQLANPDDPLAAYHALLDEVIQADADRISAVLQKAKDGLVMCAGISAPREDEQRNLKL